MKSPKRVLKWRSNWRWRGWRVKSANRSYETTGLGYRHSSQLHLDGGVRSAGEARILPNLDVKTGGAEYGSPSLQELLIVQ
jgi:hypothetical protein